MSLMSDEIFCPECGSFVETLVSGDNEVLDLECGVCGHEFEYVPEDEELEHEEDEEALDLTDLDFGDE